MLGERSASYAQSSFDIAFVDGKAYVVLQCGVSATVESQLRFGSCSALVVRMDAVEQTHKGHVLGLWSERHNLPSKYFEVKVHVDMIQGVSRDSAEHEQG